MSAQGADIDREKKETVSGNWEIELQLSQGNPQNYIHLPTSSPVGPFGIRSMGTTTCRVFPLEDLGSEQEQASRCQNILLRLSESTQICALRGGERKPCAQSASVPSWTSSRKGKIDAGGSGARTTCPDLNLSSDIENAICCSLLTCSNGTHCGLYLSCQVLRRENVWLHSARHLVAYPRAHRTQSRAQAFPYARGVRP